MDASPYGASTFSGGGGGGPASTIKGGTGGASGSSYTNINAAAAYYIPGPSNFPFTGSQAQTTWTFASSATSAVATMSYISLNDSTQFMPFL